MESEIKAKAITRQFLMEEDKDDHAFLDAHETLSHLTE
jgi:hypothetical protein